MFLSAPIKGGVQCYAWLHSKIHEYQWSHDAGKAGHTCWEDSITQTTCTNVLHVRIHVLCLCWVSALFSMICCLFYNCNKKVKRSIEICPLQGERLWIVFSFKILSRVLRTQEEPCSNNSCNRYTYISRSLESLRWSIATCMGWRPSSFVVR